MSLLLPISPSFILLSLDIPSTTAEDFSVFGVRNTQKSVAETPGMKGCDSLCINCWAKLRCKWMQTRRAIILVQQWMVHRASLVSSKLTIWVKVGRFGQCDTA